MMTNPPRQPNTLSNTSLRLGIASAARGAVGLCLFFFILAEVQRGA